MKTTKPLFMTLILTFGVLFQAHAQSWLTNGLVAYYPFNGNANDASGNGYNAVVGSGVQLTNGVDGSSNSAYRGISSGNISNNNIGGSGINLANSSLTVSLWFKKDYQPYTLDHGSILTLGTESSAGKQLHIRPYLSGVQLRFSFYFDDFDVATPVGNGDWSHIVCTYDNATRERRIYVDGGLIATNVAVRGFTGTTDFLFIPSGLGTAPSGLIDQVRFYNRVLSANEVASLRLLESGPHPHMNLIKAVKPVSSSLLVGTNYQLQISGDLVTWTNHGAPFAATNSSIVYPEYFDVDNWNKLFFRLQVAP